MWRITARNAQEVRALQHAQDQAAEPMTRAAIARQVRNHAAFRNGVTIASTAQGGR
jgi:hypothetical protein